MIIPYTIQAKRERASATGHLGRWLGTLTVETARAYGTVLRRLAETVEPLRASEQQLAVFVQRAPTVLMRRRRVSALHSFYRSALDRGLLVRDPSRNLYLRRLELATNQDLLDRVGLARGLTWGALLASACERSGRRWRTKAGAELLRRVLAKMRACRDEHDLLDTLAQPVQTPDVSRAKRG